MDLNGKAGRVTGAGSGIGRATELQLAARGCSVLVNDLVEAAAVAVVKEIETAGGRAGCDAPKRRPRRPPELPVLARYFQAAAGYMAYSGKFHVEGDRVVHELEDGLLPEWIDTNLVRNFEFEDDDTLRLKGDTGGLVQHLLWKRV